MATKEQLQKRVEELEQENDDLQDQLDQIFDIVAPPEEQGQNKKDAVPTRGKKIATGVPRDGR